MSNALSHANEATSRIAYFSMEVGFDHAMPTYSGGLGVLAGDTLLAAADLVVPMVGVTLYSGKAHPQDEGGKSIIRRLFQAQEALRGTVDVIYLEEYDMSLAKYICSGVDLWLNTAQKPQEASGTSGMKAALNGVPSLSVLDGWWIEGHEEGVTGWSIGDDLEHHGSSPEDSDSLYDKLEQITVPMYYNQPMAWAKVMRSAMVSQYVDNVYSTSRPDG